ncbi:MAG: hypothetical protein QW279_06790 [Candidatus Jordarchaeaceae archaeon]
MKKRNKKSKNEYPKGPKEHVYELKMEKKLKKLIREKERESTCNSG